MSCAHISLCIDSIFSLCTGGDASKNVPLESLCFLCGWKFCSTSFTGSFTPCHQWLWKRHPGQVRATPTFCPTTWKMAWDYIWAFLKVCWSHWWHDCLQQVVKNCRKLVLENQTGLQSWLSNVTSLTKAVCATWLCEWAGSSPCRSYHLNPWSSTWIREDPRAAGSLQRCPMGFSLCGYATSCQILALWHAEAGQRGRHTRE